jgi:hypothetical protein
MIWFDIYARLKLKLRRKYLTPRGNRTNFAFLQPILHHQSFRYSIMQGLLLFVEEDIQVTNT